MATLTLTKLFINLMQTGAAVSAQSADRSRKHSIDGKVRTFAGGRQRSIAIAGERTEFPFTLVYVPEADITTLRSWINQTVELRDHRGQRYVGTFYELNVDEIKDVLGSYYVKSILYTVTYTEGV